MPTPPRANDDDPEPLLRTLAPQVLGAMLRRFGDFAAAEDAVQATLAAAARHWADEGVPDDPRTWLIGAAARRMTDVRDTRGRRREAAALDGRPGAITPDDRGGDGTGDDDTLRLLYLCTHPALGEHSAIVLTLRAVGGLTTAEIAGTFLVGESSMGLRIGRATQALRKAGATFALPSEDERAARFAAVLRVLYLIFSEGHVSGAAASGVDLAAEAIRLTRAVHRRLPDDPEVAGLLALSLLTDARREARIGEQGELIPVAEQDRGRWDRAAIDEGLALVAAAQAFGRTGPYQVQAAIAAVHAGAARADDTDWPRILALYEALERMTPNPMITLNRAIALAMVDGPAAGLALVDALDTDAALAGHYRLDAVRGHLCELAGDLEAAHGHYLAAAGKAASIPERNYLSMKAAMRHDGPHHDPIAARSIPRLPAGRRCR